MDIMAILASSFPNVQAHSVGLEATYENIVWEGGDPLPSFQQLEDAHLKAHIDAKITELSDACAAEIIQGFESAALGTVHIYDSQAVDQLNLVGSFLFTGPDPDHPDGQPTYYAVRPVIDGVVQLKEYKVHTHWQLKKAITDGVYWKLAKLQRFNDMRTNILTTARTVEEIDAITWETNLV